MARPQRCARLVGGQGSADPSGSGRGAEVTLFDEGESPADNLGLATLFAVETGHIAAAFHDGEVWIVVTPHGTGGELHLSGCLTSQLRDE